MLVYVILLASISVVYLVCGEKKKKFLYISGILIFLLLALKSQSVGVDTVNYARMYYSTTIEYVNMFLQNFPNISLNLDPLYFFYSYFFLQLGFSVQLYFAISYGIVIFLIFRWIYQYSENKFISVFTYITIGMFSLSMSGFRQTISLAIITLTYQYIIKRKFLQFLMIVLIAAGFHMSAIIFIPAYFIVKLFEKKRVNVILILSIIIGFLCLNIFYYMVSKINLEVRFIKYLQKPVAGTNPLFVFSYIMIAIVCIVLQKMSKISMEKDENKMYIIIFSIGLTLMIFSLHNTMVSRLSYYYIFVLPIILSNSVQRVCGTKNRLICKIACCIIEAFYFFITAPSSVLRIAPYSFFWQ